jgi:hypothetical protein
MDQKIQMITSVLFRTIGPLLLRSGGLGGGGGVGGGNTSSSFDDDDDDDDDDSKKNTAGRSKVKVSLPTFPPDEDDEDDEDNNVSQSSAITKSSIISNPATLPTRIDLLNTNSLTGNTLRTDLNLDYTSDLPKEDSTAVSTTVDNNLSSQ